MKKKDEILSVVCLLISKGVAKKDELMELIDDSLKLR